MTAIRRAITMSCLVLAPLTALAQAPVSNPGSVDARLARIERTLSSGSLAQMHETMQRLRQEVRQLRGQIELQQNELRKLKRSQRQLYSDLDQRITAAQGAPPPGASPGPGTQPSAAIPPPSVASAAPPPQTPAPAPAPAPTIPAQAADPAAEQRAYQDAFALLKSGKYSKASKAFDGFLREYPNGRFSDNAQYWLGESYYVSRQFNPALKAFEGLVASFPDSPKRSHALLKIGFIHDEAGRKDQARKVLNDLVAADPSSTAAGLARKRLARLQ